MYRWFENLVPPFPDAPQGEPPRSLVAFCRFYTEGAWPTLAIMALATSLLAVAEVSLFGFIGNLVDWLAAHSRESFLAEEQGALLWMGALAALGLPLLSAGHSLLTHQALLGNYPMRIRWRVHRYLLGQSLAFFRDEFSGRIATKLMQTALAVREVVIKVLNVLNYVAVYFAGVLVIVGRSDTWLLVPFCAWLACYLLLLRIFVPRLAAISERQADARSLMTGRIVDSYTNIATVKLFSHSAREEQYAKEGMNAFLGTVHVQMRRVTELWVSLYVLNSALLVVLAALTIRLWMRDAISLGGAAVGLGLALKLQGMSQWIMWEASALFENIGTVQDGITTIARPQVVRDKAEAKPLRVSGGAIEFERIVFGYDPGRHVFDGLTLAIRQGERVGLIGRSGAGKSTLLSLLMRFHDLSGGEIRIDGQPIDQVQQDSLRAQVGFVTQDTSLLHRSIRDNIAYGRPQASESEIVAAARRASADEFIRQQKDSSGREGYDAHVGERGVNLSGGQRQRIAIARAILKDAPILLLDEATSALDSEVEAAIQESLQELMERKTVVAIAHRLSTISALDRLIVLDEGRILQMGSHSELLAAGGLYADLWARQSGGFLGLAAQDPAGTPAAPRAVGDPG